ncbi:MAG: hypothetical protein IBJ07_10975 [Rhizobiaceae bacterium]|nr:hypothetical protein [Rhizobiaceae bacterium]
MAGDARCRQATVTGMTTTKGLAAFLAIHLAVAVPLLLGGATHAHAESGSGSDGSGGGGSDSSGSGSDGGGSDNSGSESDNSGHGGGGDDGDGSGNSGSGRSGSEDGGYGGGAYGEYSGGDPIGRFMEALGAFGGVESSQRDGASIELHYDDGWREVISNGRYGLFDRQGRQVVGRAANRLDFERMDAARR